MQQIQAVFAGHLPPGPITAPLPQAAGDPTKIYTGVLARFGPTVGGAKVGFIRCAETFPIYNCDIRVQQAHCSVSLEVGAVLRFNIRSQLSFFEGQGQSAPSANNVVPVSDLETYHAVKKENQCEYLDGVEYVGWVIRQDGGKGRVIIDCETLKDHPWYRTGIYVQGAAATDLKPGMKVSFHLQMNEAGGYQGWKCEVIPGENVSGKALDEMVRRSDDLWRRSKGSGKSRAFDAPRGKAAGQIGIVPDAARGKAPGQIGIMPAGKIGMPANSSGKAAGKVSMPTITSEQIRMGSQANEERYAKGTNKGGSSMLTMPGEPDKPLKIEELEGYIPEDDPPNSSALFGFRPY